MRRGRESKRGEDGPRCDRPGRAMTTRHRATRRRRMRTRQRRGDHQGREEPGERRGPGTYPGAPELKAGPPSHLELATFQRPPNCEPPQVAGKPFTSPLIVDSSRRGPASTRKYKMSRHPWWGATSARTWSPDAGKIPRAPTSTLRASRGSCPGAVSVAPQVSGKPNLTPRANAPRRRPDGSMSPETQPAQQEVT
jgi:hypothetical protein